MKNLEAVAEEAVCRDEKDEDGSRELLRISVQVLANLTIGSSSPYRQGDQ